MSAGVNSDKAQSWGPRIALVLVATVLIPVGASVLYTYSPTEYTYLPCWLHALTGLHCPGCGGTRCASALLHGDLEQAFAYNPLVVIASPWLAYHFGGIACSFWTGKKFHPLRLPKWCVWIVVGAIILFAIARNIPVYPLNLLAPHSL